MALLVKHIFFKIFLNRDNKNDDCYMIIHAKFEVNGCCGWDFRHEVNLLPPMHKRYHRHPMHNRVKDMQKKFEITI